MTIYLELGIDLMIKITVLALGLAFGAMLINPIFAPTAKAQQVKKQKQADTASSNQRKTTQGQTYKCGTFGPRGYRPCR
jgi:hypothetical protein